MRDKFENKNMTEIDSNEKDLFLQIDFLQEKLDEFEDNEEEVLKMREKLEEEVVKRKQVLEEEVVKRKEVLEEEVVKRKKILEENNFYRHSSIDLINQLNHVQDLFLKKIRDYDRLKLENNQLVKEVSMIYESLDKYKILSVEQNRQILRAIKLINDKKI